MMTFDEWLDHHCTRRDQPLEQMLWSYNLDTAIEGHSPAGVAHCLQELDAQVGLDHVDWEHVLHQCVVAAQYDKEGVPLPPGTAPSASARAVHELILRQPELPIHLVWQELGRDAFPNGLLAPTAEALARHPSPLPHGTIATGLTRLLNEAPDALEAMLAAWRSRFADTPLKVTEVMRAAIRLDQEGVAKHLWTWARHHEDPNWHQGTRNRALSKNMPNLYVTLVHDYLDPTHPNVQKDLWLDVVVHRNIEAIVRILPLLTCQQEFLKDLQQDNTKILWHTLDEALVRAAPDLEPWRQFLETHSSPGDLPLLSHWRLTQHRDADLVNRIPSAPRATHRRRA